MEAHTQPTTSAVVEELQPAPQQEASTSEQQAIQPPHSTALTADQHLRLRLVPKKKKKKKKQVSVCLYSL